MTDLAITLALCALAAATALTLADSLVRLRSAWRLIKEQQHG